MSFIRELPMLRHGRFITNLHADMKYFPVSKPIQQADGTMIEAAPSSKKINQLYLNSFFDHFF